MSKSKKNSIPPALVQEKLDDPMTLDLDLDMDLNFDLSELDQFGEKPPPNPEVTAITLQKEVTPPPPLMNEEPPPISSKMEKEHNLSSMVGSSGSEATLALAQKRIDDLENKIASLENDKNGLVRAGDTFRKLNEEHLEQIQSLKKEVAHLTKTHRQENGLLKQINEDKGRQILDLKKHLDSLQAKIDGDIHGVRKREKDLEHKLEIAKMEEIAVVKSKDQLILDLKRRIDRIQMESENFRQKSQANYQQLQDKNRVIRGVVRALRIALTKLEGDSDSTLGLKELSGASQELKKSG